jgi:hypothetical protein
MVNRRICFTFTIKHLLLFPFTIYRMSFYPPKINEKFTNAQNVGKLADAKRSRDRREFCVRHVCQILFAD